MKGAAVIILGVVLAVAVMAARPTEAVSCGDVQAALSPCIEYLTGGGGGNPSSACCSGAQGLAGRVQSREDRQTVCNCLKSGASSYNINYSAASSLPGKCGVSMGYSVDPNIDCSQVS